MNVLLPYGSNCFGLPGNPIVITHGSMLKALIGSHEQLPPEDWHTVMKRYGDCIIEDGRNQFAAIDYPNIEDAGPGA